MVKKLILLIVLPALIWAGTAHAQSANESKARAYYFSAQESFTANDYVNALNYLQSAENMLGKSNARIEALRAKTLYHKGDVEGAKRSLDKFFGYAPSASLTREMTGYTRDIEAKYEEGKARAAAARRAQVEKDRQARIAADKHARDQAAAAEKKRQEEANRVIERQKMRASLKMFMESCDTASSCDALYSQLRAEQKKLSAIKKNYTSNIEEWFKTYNETKAKSIAIHVRKCAFTPSDDCIYSYATMLREHMLYTRMQDRKIIALAFEVANEVNCNGKGEFDCVVDAALILFLEGCNKNHTSSCVSALKDWKRINRRGIPAGGSETDFLRKTCDLNEVEACWRLALKTFRVAKVWTSEVIRYADKACSLGRQDACDELSLALWLGRHKMKKNRKLAKTYHERSCSFVENANERKVCLKSNYWKKVAVWNFQ